MKLRIFSLAALVALAPISAEAAMCPDGSYVAGSTCQMAPDGSYVSGGAPVRMAPDGTFTSGQPRMAPNGSYVGGTDQ